MKKVFAMLLAAVMVAALFAGCGAGSADANTIKIGMTGPLTGDAAIYGTAVKNGIEIAVAEINEKAKAEGGLKIEFKAEDDEADGEKAVSGSSAFTDVVKGSWYEKAVDWASANGIVTGYDATHFGPNDHVTRQQMAAILWRYAKYKGLDVAANGTVMPDFPDRGQIASWAGEAVSWAYSRGVMNGRNDGRLDPNGKATRAEAAVMLSRFLNLTPKGEKQ